MDTELFEKEYHGLKEQFFIPDSFSLRAEAILRDHYRQQAVIEDFKSENKNHS